MQFDVDETKQKKSKIPYIFFGFFAVVFVVNFFYIYVAKKTWSGLVTTDSYQKGLHYNDTLKQAEEQKKLGWNLEVKFKHQYDNKGAIFFSLKNEKFQTIQDAEIYIDFKRPAQEGMDFSRQVKFADGVYQTEVEFPLQGQWDFTTLVIKDGQRFVQEERRVIKW